jgi:hypothetical protein
MATKKAPGKKGSTKKSSKKSSKKATKKAAAVALPPPGFPNIQCLLAAYQRYLTCLRKGVAPATCQKRLQRNIMNCLVPGTVDPGPDEE